jgi:hypothetical protein
MNPEPIPRPETHVADFADILSPPDGSEPPVIVGGHAVNLWAMYFLSTGVDELSKHLPFTSKDLDLVGTWDLLERLHQRLKGKLARSEPRSPVLGRLVVPSPSGEDLTIEVLHTVKGLDFKELARTVDLQADEVFGRVLMPHLVLKAKIENAVTIEQSGRNDVKHVGMMILVVRAFISELAGQVAEGGFSGRTLVNFLGETWEIVASSQAEEAARLWAFDFSKIWPREELESTGNDKISRWLQHRLPGSPA